MQIFCASLSYKCSAEELTALFAQYGTVKSVHIITDKDDGRSKGYGFISMSDSDAVLAIAELNGTKFMGRTLVVNEARPPKKRDKREGVAR